MALSGRTFSVRGRLDFVSGAAPVHCLVVGLVSFLVAGFLGGAPARAQDTVQITEARTTEDLDAEDLDAEDLDAEDLDATVYEGWYVVRPGDTLEEITQRYLGDSERWRENWRLNPEIRNPHALQPGQRLRILVRAVPDDGAVLTQMENRVEDQLPPLAWQLARVHDVLRPRDSVRTFEASSAELTFGDDTRLLVSEDSLVFLDREVLPGTGSSGRGVPGGGQVSKDQIEIVVGQADLGGRGRSRNGEAIELLIGDAVAVPEAGPEGTVRARARKAGSGAQLMAYRGTSQLASGGVEIEVPQGMGSAVPEGEPPGPPEELLPAPVLESPKPGARLKTPSPDFRWAAVDGAAAYVIEVCRDPDCARLVARESVATTPGHSHTFRLPDELPVSDLHWRVTAVSSSALDGYPAAARPLAILSESEDTTAPEVAFEVDGPHLPPRSGLNRSWILGTEARLRAVATDEQSGIDRWLYVLDGQETSEDAWSGPWQPGAHSAMFVAYDGAGNGSMLPTVPLVYDVEPPTLSWGIENAGFRGRIDAESRILAASDDAAGVSWSHARRVVSVRDPHSLWPWREQVWTVRHDGRQLTLTPNRPVLLVVEGGTADDLSVVLGPERGLWVLAEDEACGPSLRLGYDLDIEVTRGPSGRSSQLTLLLAADDAVGHRASAALRMTAAKADREARARLEDEGGRTP